jgi:hypothetical protein
MWQPRPIEGGRGCLTSQDMLNLIYIYIYIYIYRPIESKQVDRHVKSVYCIIQHNTVMLD